jgi:hypothetical protein
MLSFKQYLGPEATTSHDSEEIARQKRHLTDKAKENHEQSAHERMYGHGGAAEAKAKSYENARDNIKEDGAGGMGGAMPTNNVSSGGVAGTGGAGGEPGVSKKRNPTMSFFKRKQPKM